MTNATIKSNEPCWCGSGRKFKRWHKASTEPLRPGRLSPARPVPDSIARPPYAEELLALDPAEGSTSCPTPLN